MRKWLEKPYHSLDYMLQDRFKEKVYKTVIPRNIKLSEAPSAGICIFDYDGSSVGAQAYKELAKEVLSRNG